MKSGGFHLNNNEKTEAEVMEEITTEEEVKEEIITEEEAVEESVPEEEVTLCENCGENPCADGYEVCEECLVKMKNTRIPLIGWIAAAVSVIFGMIAASTIVFMTAPSLYVLSAESAALDNRWGDANYYYSYMSDTVDEFKSLIEWEKDKDEPLIRRLFTVGTNTKAKMFEAYAKAYNPMEAINKIVIGSHTSYDEVLSMEKALIEHEKVKPYWDIFSGIVYTEEVFSYSEEYPEEENYANFIKYYEFIETQEGTDAVYIAFMKYVVAAAYDEPVEVQKQWLDTCDKLAKESGRDYRWLYYSYYADLIARTGNADSAVELLDALVAENKNNFNAYIQKNKILLSAGRFEEAEKMIADVKAEFGNYGEVYEMEVTMHRYKGEYDEAKSVAETIMQENDSFPEIHRQLALIYLAEGDYKSAFDEMDATYANVYNMYAQFGTEEPTEELVLTYYACARLLEATGDFTEDEANGIGRAYSIFGEDYEPQGDIKAIIDGEKTVKQILTEGDCDLI